MILTSHLRVEPDLVGVPLVMVESDGSRSIVTATSELAERVGIVVGMKTSQARAAYDGLVVRKVRREVIAAAAAALADVALTVGSRVELQGDDRVFIDCRGTAALWPSESALATALSARAHRCGLDAWVGIADSKLGAVIAAREGGGVCIVPVGGLRRFLAPRAVSLLDPDPAMALTLDTWGIRSIGDLLALPAGAAMHRLGPLGAEMIRRARGEDDAPIAVRPMSHTFEEALELEYAVDRVEPLLFVLRRLFECLASRLEIHALGCREIRVALSSDGSGSDVRCIPVVAPTADRRTLSMLVRAQLESDPPPFAVTAVAVACIAARLPTTQLDLFRPAAPTPAALTTVLARLSTLCGPDRVGVLRDVGTHRPEAIQVDPFSGWTSSTARMTSVAEPSASRVEMPAAGAVVRVALRAFRPPVPIEVFESRDRLDYVRAAGLLGGRVVHWAGPWRVRGEWWTGDPYAREYYDVELTDGGVYRIYRDVRSGEWMAGGVYD